MIDMKDWKWRGIAGHYTCSGRCLFSMRTDIGKYTISTVGAMYVNGSLEQIGVDRYYETMVFRVKPNGCVESYSNLDFATIDCENISTMNRHEFDKLAEEMHLKMCLKYAEKQ